MGVTPLRTKDPAQRAFTRIYGLYISGGYTYMTGQNNRVLCALSKVVQIVRSLLFVLNCISNQNRTSTFVQRVNVLRSCCISAANVLEERQPSFSFKSHNRAHVLASSHTGPRSAISPKVCRPRRMTEAAANTFHHSTPRWPPPGRQVVRESIEIGPVEPSCGWVQVCGRLVSDTGFGWGHGREIGGS